MHELRRISVNNWYLIDDARDIELKGITALIGPMGAGKSSLLDAVQTVMTGNNQHNLRLNASASQLNDRSVLEYCLGYLDPQESDGEPMRESCETILALTFVRPDLLGDTDPVTAGVVLTARAGDRNAHTACQFLIKGHALRLRDHLTRAEDGATILPAWETLARHIRSRLADPRDLREYKTARTYVEDLLAVMRPRSNAPDPRQFLNAFANAVAFKPIQDTTAFVRRHLLRADPLDIASVRASIKRYRDNAAEAARIEEKLKAVAGVARRFDEWGRLVLRHADLHWGLACLSAEEARIGLAKARSELKAATEERALAEEIRRRQNETIRQLREALGEKTALRQASGQEARLKQVDLRAKNLGLKHNDLLRDARGVRAHLAAVANLASLRDYLPHRLMAVVAEARKVLDLMDATAGVDWLGHYEREIAAALAALPQLGALVDSLAGVLDPLRVEISAMGEARKDHSAQLAAIREGGVALSRPTRELMEELKRAGIDSVPLCNLIEVVEPEWQYAIEALLGNSREALIVEPAKLRRAFDILYRNRNQRGWKNCRLVKTDRTDPARFERLHTRSVARAVRSDDDHALCYLAINVGAFLKAESEDDLAAAERAVMRNGKMTASHAYSVNEDNVQLLFGASAREASRQRLQDELQASAKLLPEKQRLADRLQQAIEVARQLREAELPDVAGLAFRHDSLRREQAEIARDRETVLAEGDPDLHQEITQLEGDITAYEKEAEEEVEPRLRTADARHTRAVDAEERALEAMRAAVRALRLARQEVRTPDVALAAEMLTERQAPLRPYLGQRLRYRADPAGALAFMVNERRNLLGDATAERALRDFVTRVANARAAAFRDLDECVRGYQYDHPCPGGDVPAAAYRWITVTERRLREHELRNWLEETQKALAEMHRTVKEHVLSQLSDKFVRMRTQLDALNRRLAARAFSGKYYKFRADPDATMTPIRRLAEEVARNPDLGQQIVEGRIDDPGLRSALQELEKHLDEGGDARIDDYREYYTYEFLLADDQKDGPWIPIGAKVRVASGGETQLPFYVAMAASLAMAYFPGDAGALALPEGLGLAMFDEAFNKLDIPNTQALFDFYRGLGLQLFVAAPEAQRPVFTEVVDCIVTINKDVAQRTVYTDTEYPRELARAALRAINPDHKGVAGFRAELAAEAAVP